MFAAHPLQGVGLQNFIPQAPDYVLHPGALQFIHLIIERPVVVHNIYLQFLAETGSSACSSSSPWSRSR